MENEIPRAGATPTQTVGGNKGYDQKREGGRGGVVEAERGPILSQ